MNYSRIVIFLLALTTAYLSANELTFIADNKRSTIVNIGDVTVTYVLVENVFYEIFETLYPDVIIAGTNYELNISGSIVYVTAIVPENSDEYICPNCGKETCSFYYLRHRQHHCRGWQDDGINLKDRK